MSRFHRIGRSHRDWNVMSLESRLMLAGEVPCDGGASTDGARGDASTPAHHGPVADALAEAALRTPARTVVFIDTAVEDFQILHRATLQDAEVVLIDAERDGVEQITQHLRRRTQVESIHLVTHGSAGMIQIGSQTLAADNLSQHADQLRSWREALSANADLLLYGCQSGTGSRGQQLITALAHLTGADVAASDDMTGNAAAGRDWDLERRFGEIESPIALSAAKLAAFHHHLGLQIRAAGSMGDEQMQLEIDGQIVSTWSLTGTDAEQDQFLQYDYNVNGISPDSVRIRFSNAIWDPANGVDRNLRVDRINIDGVDYQSEDPSVYSTGTWRPEDGIQPGYRESEYLHSNGYFQYASLGASTTIDIFARGNEGDERMQLLIDGQVVMEFNNVGTSMSTYSYTAAGDVDIASIRVAFANDLWNPTQGIDRNLIVDAIRVNGTRYETEHPSVFSTGTWKPEDGIVPGYRQSEVLHTNGYFQYAQDLNPTPGSFAMEAESILVSENDGTIQVVITRIGGSDGAATVSYTTIGGSATAGSDYVSAAGTLSFADGQTSRSVTINLINDDISENGESFRLELTGSTGADLLTPRSTMINIVDDDDADSDLPNFSSFAGADGLQLNGNATIVGSELRLVAAATQQRGSTYFTTPIAVDADTSFQTSFAARFDGGQGSAGGEGLAFVIQNSPAGIYAKNIGDYPGGLNYNAVPNSIGIELDTFKNVYEQWADQITITVNGVMVTPVATIPSPYDLNNGQTYHVWVDYNGVSDLLSVFVSNTTIKPQAALLTASIELNEIVGDQTFVGFAAATGTAFNNTYVRSWSMTVDGGQPPAPDPVGSFVLESEFVRASEGSGQAAVTISRVGGSRGAVSVSYAMYDDTATADIDYVAAAETLNFADGETRKTVTINLIDDGDIEGTESFSFRLVGSEGASLLAPRTATVYIIDDDSLLPVYDSFESADGLQLNGNATIIGGELRVVAAAAQQRGSVYSLTPISVDANTSFQAAFAARFDGGQGSAGGEGMAFVIQNSPAGVFAKNIGDYPGGLNYNAVPNSIGIELDTFKNVYEQWADQITITVNGVMVTPVATIKSPYDLNNGQTYHVWVDYNGDSNVLAVYLSETEDKPAFALLKTTLDLSQIVGNQAYVGFAAATGTAFNNTYVRSWNMTLDAPSPNPQVYPTGTLVKKNLIDGLNQPLAVAWSPDGRNMYIAEKGGMLKVSRDGGAVQTVIDISARTNEYQDRGLLDFALHPDFANQPYIYLLYTVDPPEVYDNVGNQFAGPDGKGNRAGQLIRFTAEASTNYTTVDLGSEVILLGTASTWENFNAFTDSTLDFAEPPAGENPDGSYLRDFINSDSRSHTVGSLAFALDGALFVSIGDGASFNKTDVRALRVQDIDSLSGKVLRIDPLTGRGLTDNPFYDGDPDSNRSKVYQLGLRNPWRLSVDPVSGRLYIGETGLTSFEEVNTGGPGTNFGWPYYEGGQGVNVRTPSYQGLPQAQAFYASGQVATPALVALPHGPGSDVVALGTVANGLILGPQYDGDVFYNDFARGIVRHADVSSNGTLQSVGVFTTEAQFVVDIQQGPDDYLYYVNLVYGTVGRWELV